MKDNFDLQNQNRFNWGLIVTLLACAYYWVNVYLYGFLVPTIVTVVIASMMGIAFRLYDNNDRIL